MTAYAIEHITYDVRCGECSGFRISGLDQQSAKDEAAVHNAQHHAVSAAEARPRAGVRDGADW